MKLLAILLMGGSSVFAAQARYTLKAKCYVVETNSVTYTVQHFGRVTGLSNFSCKNAYDNAEIECDRRVQSTGQTAGSIFKDILVTAKEGSIASAERTSESKTRVLFGLAAVKNSHSIDKSQRTFSKTDVEYLQIDDQKDCDMNERIPQQDVPTIQNKDLGE